jgi:hypothetical protein
MARRNDDTPYQGNDRRAAPRLRLRSRASYHTEEVEGWGTLHDFSSSGARIDQASARLKPGERVRLSFTPRTDCLPVEVWADVVRETETGFAVRFTSLDARLNRLLHSLTKPSTRPATEDEATLPFVPIPPSRKTDDSG